MDGKTTIRYLQNYIRSKDHQPELVKDYFLKLSGEVGELAEAVRHNLIRPADSGVTGTIDEEIWDCMYYLLAIANCYDIDLEKTICDKEAINNAKYNTGIEFEQNR